MFDLYHSSPLNYNAIISYDNVNSNTGIIGGGLYANSNYKVVKFGKGIHGLNINNQVINYNDFATPISYNIHEFYSNTSVATGTPAYNGSNIIQFYKKTSVKQISGYRSGDCNLIEVPGLNYTSSSVIENNNNFSLKKYSLLSGRDKYLNFQSLNNGGNKNQVVCSFGVGRTYVIQLNGYLSILTGQPAGTTSKFIFEVRPLGLIPDNYLPQYITVDVGVVDRANNTTSLLTQNCATTGSWRATIIDQTKSGNKFIIAISRKNDSFPDDNDGTNYVDTHPYSFCEISASELIGASNQNYISLSYTLLYNYKFGTNTNNKDILVSGSSIEATTDVLGNYYMSGSKKIWLGTYTGMISSNLPTLSGGIISVKTVVGTGISNCDVVSTTSTSIGFNIYNSSVKVGTIGSIPAGSGVLQTVQLTTMPGEWRYTSTPSVSILSRIFHLAYDTSDNITVCMFKFTKITGGTILSQNYNASTSLEYTGVKLFPNSIVNGSGSATIEVNTRTQTSDSVYKYELYINGSKKEGTTITVPGVAQTNTNNITTVTFTNATSFACGWINQVSSVNTNNTPALHDAGSVIFEPPLPDYTVVSVLGTSTYSISNIAMSGYFNTDTGVKLQSYCKIDSNKLVSFNIGITPTNCDIQPVTLGTGSVPILFEYGGNMPYKATYNLLTGDIASNNLDFHTSDNPIYNSPVGYKSSLNPKTGECILYYPSDVCWV